VCSSDLGNPLSVTERTCAKCQPGCLRAAVNAACGAAGLMREQRKGSDR